jgi:hypothetical protein
MDEWVRASKPEKRERELAHRCLREAIEEKRVAGSQRLASMPVLIELEDPGGTEMRVHVCPGPSTTELLM